MNTRLTNSLISDSGNPKITYVYGTRQVIGINPSFLSFFLFNYVPCALCQLPYLDPIPKSIASSCFTGSSPAP